jgi:hypothetical protein
MSVEAHEFRKVKDDINPQVGLANLLEHLPVMRWLDLSNINNKILAVVTRRDAFLHRLIDTEQPKLGDGGSGGEKNYDCCDVHSAEERAKILYRYNDRGHVHGESNNLMTSRRVGLDQKTECTMFFLPITR